MRTSTDNGNDKNDSSISVDINGNASIVRVFLKEVLVECVRDAFS